MFSKDDFTLREKCFQQRLSLYERREMFSTEACTFRATELFAKRPSPHDIWERFSTEASSAIPSMNSPGTAFLDPLPRDYNIFTMLTGTQGFSTYVFKMMTCLQEISMYFRDVLHFKRFQRVFMMSYIHRMPMWFHDHLSKTFQCAFTMMTCIREISLCSRCLESQNLDSIFCWPFVRKGNKTF